MDSKQNELQSWKTNNDLSRSSSTSTSKSSSPTSQKPNNNKSQKVPFTLKYQLNIRKNSNDTNPIVNSPLPIGAQSGLIADLTFDQDKGQFLWATESYQQNPKKRRTTNNTNNGNSSPKPYDMKVPRPPNAFIIYHRNKSKELAKFKSAGRCETNERHPSKTVAEMWKEEPAEIKLQYQREADLALVEHKKKYPFYKYKPKKRDNKNKSKSQQINNNSSKNNKSNIKSSNNNNDKINSEDDDSQVPIEHRKQAAMESAFTVFDLSSSTSKDSSTDNTSTNNSSPPHTPPTPNIAMTNPQVMTPIWTDYDKRFFDNPINEQLNSPLQLPSPCPPCPQPLTPQHHRQQQQQQQQQQPPCQCTAHCLKNHNNNNNIAVISALESLSSEQWNAVSLSSEQLSAVAKIFNNVLETIGAIHPSHPTPTTTSNMITPPPITATSIGDNIPSTSIANNIPINTINHISTNNIPSTSIANNIITSVDNMITMSPTFNAALNDSNYYQIAAQGWNMNIDDMGNITTNYVVPSQSTPPTPTSPIDYLSWTTSQSIDDSQQFAANPITNITNIEHFPQINQQTNNNLFTTPVTDNDNDIICNLFDHDFDGDYNFTL
ncbi:hypothetical protein C1645_872067 [Glomus cerebriforme]|uniref:HMG box domain-containing protein n=1 Tax=Glomus cerebriforme TaxID=658196 RepID=A0A397TNT7_9GLOM|nr:hypothetical protein C1645_872067 [Glomus cerebriforme]